MRICSFLPSGTEMVCALGLEKDLVGVSHECDYPATVKGKPVVVTSAADTSGMSSREADAWVSERMKKGESLYRVDEKRLADLKPDLIITQDLCQVCAPSGNEAKKALAVVPASTKVIYLSPRTLEDIFANIRSVGEATGTLERAKEIIYGLRLRAVGVQSTVFTMKNKPKVFVLEWVDPPFTGGHWVPEMVSIAGGVPEASCEGKDSVRMSWDDVAKFNPDVVICAPCGFDLPRALKEAERLKDCPAAERINAFRTGQVYAVDANAYVARPGPRVVDGIELFAHILHPEKWPWRGPKDAFRRVDLRAIAGGKK